MRATKTLSSDSWTASFHVSGRARFSPYLGAETGVEGGLCSIEVAGGNEPTTVRRSDKGIRFMVGGSVDRELSEIGAGEAASDIGSDPGERQRGQTTDADFFRVGQEEQNGKKC